MLSYLLLRNLFNEIQTRFYVGTNSILYCAVFEEESIVNFYFIWETQFTINIQKYSAKRFVKPAKSPLIKLGTVVRPSYLLGKPFANDRRLYDKPSNRFLVYQTINLRKLLCKQLTCGKPVN